MVLIILNFKIFWMKLIIWILIILSFVKTLMTSFVLSISFVQRFPVAFFFQGYRELSIFLHIVIDSTGICLGTIPVCNLLRTKSCPLLDRYSLNKLVLAWSPFKLDQKQATKCPILIPCVALDTSGQSFCKDSQTGLVT